MIGELETRYELTTRLGDGPTGILWKALSRDTGKNVAIKVLHPHLAADPRTVERFAQERPVLTAFVHPVMVRVHEVVAQDNLVALVRDLVPGSDLRNPQDRESPISARHAVILAAQVAEALAVLHQSGGVHGGLKPTNLIVSRARVWLTDCRVALLALPEPDSANDAGRGYAAPECVDGEPPGPAADVYALGRVLRETLAQCPRDETPDLPPALQDLIVACLESDRAARPPTEAVARRLRSIRDEHSLSAAACAPPPPTTSGLAAPAPPRPDDPDDRHTEPAAGTVTPSERARPGRGDPGPTRQRTPAEPPEPGPEARPGRAAHARMPPDRRRGSVRRQQVMVGVVSGALLMAGILGVVVRNLVLSGSSGASPAVSDYPTEVGSRVPAPADPGVSPTSTVVARSPVVDQSLAGATQFVSEWFGALNQAVSSGNTSRLDAVSAEGCVACVRARQVVQDAYRGGGSLRGGVYQVRSVRADSFWSPSHRVLQVVFDRSPRSSLTAAGTVRSTMASATFATCELVLEWEPHGWRVHELLGTPIA
jgi:hypothetical protein